MSHSDSEVNKNRDEFKKKLHVEFKPKRCLKYRRYLAPKREFLKKSLRDLKLLCAVYYNNTELAEHCINLGASPDSTNIYGSSALHIAASKGYTDMVQLLLEKGANPNERDALCNTPLHLAACTHNLQIINLLLKAGADVRRLDVYGKNPLHLAESKLQLLQRSWREGAVETIQVRAELELIVDIFISVLKQSQTETSDTSFDDLQLMKLSLNSDEDNDVDDQMTKLLTGLQNFKIS